jgi:hypothetical protein
MANYEIQVFCNECSGVHRMGIRIALDEGPDDRASIGDMYAGKELPSRVAALINNRVSCPATGKMTLQKDNNQVFLVRVA